METAPGQNTELYILRHATPAVSKLPNRQRPLSELGQRQAEALATHLSPLGLTSAYSSPFKRALASIAPFCRSANLTPIPREALKESGPKEELPEVRARMLAALGAIAADHPGQRVLVCSHGGCLWGVISHFDEDFGYEDYRRIGTPDMRKVVFGDGGPRLDTHFEFAFSSD